MRHHTTRAGADEVHINTFGLKEPMVLGDQPGQAEHSATDFTHDFFHHCSLLVSFRYDGCNRGLSRGEKSPRMSRRETTPNGHQLYMICDAVSPVRSASRQMTYPTQRRSARKCGHLP